MAKKSSKKHAKQKRQQKQRQAARQVLHSDKESNYESDFDRTAVKLSQVSISKENDPTSDSNIVSSTQEIIKLNLQPSGLPNLGNTCYFNSVMQVLGQTYILHQLLNERSKSNNWVAKTFYLKAQKAETNYFVSEQLHLTLQPPSKIIATVMNLQREIFQGLRNTNPRILLGEIRKERSQFEGFAQQDSQELLISLIDILKKAEKKRQADALIKGLSIEDKKCPTEEDRAKAKRFKITANHTVLDAIFGGQLLSFIHCSECNYRSFTFEQFMDLSLSLNLHSNNKTVDENRREHTTNVNYSRNKKGKRWNQSEITNFITEPEPNLDSTVSVDNNHCATRKQRRAAKKAARRESRLENKKRLNESIEEQSNDEDFPQLISLTDIPEDLINPSVEKDSSDNLETELTEMKTFETSYKDYENTNNTFNTESNLSPKEPNSILKNILINQDIDSLSKCQPICCSDSENKLKPDRISDDFDCASPVNKQNLNIDDSLFVNSSISENNDSILNLGDSCELKNSPKIDSECLIRRLVKNETGSDSGCGEDDKEIGCDDNQFEYAVDDRSSLPQHLYEDEKVFDNKDSATVDEINLISTQCKIDSDSTQDGNNISASSSDSGISANAKESSKANSFEDDYLISHIEPEFRSNFFDLAMKRLAYSDDCFDNRDLGTLFKNFIKPEILDGPNKYLCESCSKKNGGNKTYSKATRCQMIALPPPILIVHLKRFEASGFGYRRAASMNKLNTSISFPEYLNLSPYTSKIYESFSKFYEPDFQKEDQERDLLEYQLYGVVIHSGCLRSGHYMAYVSVRPDQFYSGQIDRFLHLKPFLPNIEHILSVCYEEEVSKQNNSSSSSLDFTPEGENVELSLSSENNSTISRGQRKWFFISDSSVSSTTLDSILSDTTKPYLLFYERIC
ncbi:hypothetical protein RDWZM_008243 [Blomia tropicalis]|uniref:Ubiquitin carboxyl-terminal hydrolase n=1 Tax=Blomia tropicalis TaxID=40697 RepID=A0A9Q0RJW4_BLOTA|nr:hypothetical protein RDWZM_008243 [Blomia tropicalis]